MCLFPKRVKITLKNGFQTYMEVPCGRCIECLNTRVSDWVYRLQIEHTYSHRAVFVTLTYEDSFLPAKGVSVDDLQKHFKRVRKRLNTFRYYATAEYGCQTLRPHYHYIAFTNDDVSRKDLYDIILSSWSKGHIVVKPLTKGRIIYCVGYLKGQFTPEGKNKVFSLMSRKPALGSQILDNEQFVKHCYDNNFSYILRNGHKIHLPRYYKRKLKTEDCTPVDMIKLLCLKCKQHYYNKLEYSKTHFVSDVKQFLNPYLSGLYSHDNVNYLINERERAEKKDRTLKERNKKTRKLL